MALNARIATELRLDNSPYNAFVLLVRRVFQQIVSEAFLAARASRDPGACLQMPIQRHNAVDLQTDAEIRGLCIRSREVFMQQPILLELEAPIKVCWRVCGNTCSSRS